MDDQFADDKLNAALEHAMAGLAADGMPEGEPPSQRWDENIKPICWPDIIGRYAPARRFVAKD